MIFTLSFQLVLVAKRLAQVALLSNCVTRTICFISVVDGVTHQKQLLQSLVEMKEETHSAAHMFRGDVGVQMIKRGRNATALLLVLPHVL